MGGRWKDLLGRMTCGVKGWKVDAKLSECYDLIVNVEKIRKRLSGGFRPFVLRTSDGQKYQIPHPEFIALGKYDVVVVNRSGEIDILDPLHIVSIKLLKIESKSASKS
jgi:hypothetical protein